MSVTEIPEIEGAMRDFLRTVPEITALVQQRVFFGVPANTQWPIIVVQLIVETVDDNTPVTDPLLQFDCWGEGQNKAQAAAVKNALIGVLHGLEAGTLIAPAVRSLGVSGILARWRPDPASNQARYIVDATCSGIAKAA